MPRKSPNPTDIAIGARVRALRTARGMSQTDLADACDITFQQMQKYENATNRISGSRMQQIADALKVPVSALFGEADIDVQPIVGFARVDLNIAKAASDLDPPTKAHLLAIINGIRGTRGLAPAAA